MFSVTKQIDEWFNSKKKTHWKTWECVGTDHPPGTWSWVLFFTDSDYDGSYHYGVASSETDAHTEIKWVIGTYLENNNKL